MTERRKSKVMNSSFCYGKEMEMTTLKVRITLLEEALGTAPSDPSIYKEFIVENAPKEQDTSDEIEASEKQVVTEEKRKPTIFTKDEDGNAITWNYQLRGCFKESIKFLRMCKGEKFSKWSCKLSAYQKTIDGTVFVEPRKLKWHMPEGEENGWCVRPLRAQTPSGERITIASSETIPAGSWIECSILILSDDKGTRNAIVEALNLGKYHGLGQWRNSGKGIYRYEILEETTDDILPEVAELPESKRRGRPKKEER